jgi:hypothetical protein
MWLPGDRGMFKFLKKNPVISGDILHVMVYLWRFPLFFCRKYGNFGPFKKNPLNDLDWLLFCSQAKKKKKPLILDVSRMGYKILHA